MSTKKQRRDINIANEVAKDNRTKAANNGRPQRQNRGRRRFRRPPRRIPINKTVGGVANIRRNGNESKEEDIEEVPSRLRNNNNMSMSKRMSVKNLIHHSDLFHYVEAQVNPFSSSAFGAQRPDQSGASLKFPCTDQFVITIDPTTFVDVTMYPQFEIYAFMVCFVPRSISTGWLAGDEIVTGSGVGTNTHTTPHIPFTMYDVDGTILEVADKYTQAETEFHLPISDPYALMVIPITKDGWSLRRLYASEEAAVNTPVGVGYNLFRYPRLPSYLPSSEGCRILGAGIKLQATAPPLLTGGFCYGGSIKPSELFDTFSDERDLINQTPTPPNGPWFSIKNNILDRRGFKATQGVTTRYVPLNDPYQLEFHATVVPSFPPVSTNGTWAPPGPKTFSPIKTKNRYRVKNIKQPKSSHKDIVNEYTNEHKEEFTDIINYTQINNYSTPGGNNNNNNNNVNKNKPKNLGQNPPAVNHTIIKNTNLSLSKQDLSNPDDPIPVLWFQYAKNTDTQNPNAYSAYPLEFRSRVHVENEPEGTTAILSKNPDPDPCLQVVEDYIGSSTNIPISTAGNSFRSILTKFGNIAGHVGRWASRAEQIAKILMG